MEQLWRWLHASVALVLSAKPRSNWPCSWSMGSINRAQQPAKLPLTPQGRQLPEIFWAQITEDDQMQAGRWRMMLRRNGLHLLQRAACRRGASQSCDTAKYSISAFGTTWYYELALMGNMIRQSRRSSKGSETYKRAQRISRAYYCLPAITELKADMQDVSHNLKMLQGKKACPDASNLDLR